MNRIKNLLIFLLAAISAVYIYKYYSFESHIARMVRTIAVTNPTPAQHYTDKNGVQHIVTKDNLTTYTYKEAVRQSTFIQPYMDTIADALRIPGEQISGASTLKLSMAADHIRFLEQQVDSLQRITYQYHDRYLELKVRAARDSSNFDFHYNADLNTIRYWKPRKFLGIRIAKDYYTDISMADPRATIKGLSTFTILPEDGPKFKLSATTTYQSGSGMSAGPTLEMKLKPITLTGSVQYNFNQRAWQPSISADYAIISF